MSQMTGTANDNNPDAKVSKTGRAVLVLALFVVLSVVLLHELDNSPATFAANAPVEQTTATTALPLTTTTLQARSPADVMVLVANGVGTPGAAAKVAARLQPVGYRLAKPGNTTDKQVNSAVLYTAGYQAEAMAIATSLGIAASSVQAMPNPSPISDLQSSNVVVVVGNDLASAAAPATDSGTTATTSIMGTGPLTTNTTAAVTTTTTLAAQ